MTTNVTLEEVSQARKARKRALEEYEDQQRFRDDQTFRTARSELRPARYDDKLDAMRQQTCEGSGEWLREEDNFKRWRDPMDRTLRCLWLHGVPGAGLLH